MPAGVRAGVNVVSGVGAAVAGGAGVTEEGVPSQPAQRRKNAINNRENILL